MASSDPDGMENPPLTNKSHVPHFNFRDPRITMLPLMMLLALGNADANTNGVT